MGQVNAAGPGRPVAPGEARAVFEEAWAELLPIGRADDGSYHRLAWTPADLAARAWFRRSALARGLVLDEDANGNQWAWWGEPGPDAVVTGSHLDSVPGGGAFDGPLGVVSAFLALDRLRGAGRTRRPVAVVNFADEEGGRFGVACAGSRLATGSLDARRALELVDRDGVSLAEAMAAAGLDPTRCGPDPERIARIGTFVELHIEQGRRLVDLDVAVGVATAVWPHGRWRYDFTGRGDHAGTTRLADRADPVLPLAHTVLAARAAAVELDAVATVGRLEVRPGAVNAIASAASAWLDARAPSAPVARALVELVSRRAEAAGAEHGVGCSVVEESWTGGADFAPDLRRRVAAAVAERLGGVAELPTAAGHDAAILAACVPSAMLFVRNPTGTSHDPAEAATMQDCAAGVEALSAVLAALVAE